ASITTAAFAQGARDRDWNRGRGNDNAASYYDHRCDSRRPAEQADCARQTLAAADRALNDQYQRLLRTAQQGDRVRGPRQPGWYSQEVALRTAQRAWIAMRDADCKFVTQPDINRRMANLTYTMCLVDRTEARAASLQQMDEQMADRRGPNRRL